MAVVLRRGLLAAPLVAGIMVLWYAAVELDWVTVVSSPLTVAKEMWDFAIGGIYNDPYSKSLHIHLWDSARRVLTGLDSQP